MILYIIRHPQTEWNLQKRLQWHKDSPLTGLWREISHDLGVSLQGRDIDGIISSNLGRCVQTAKIIADTLVVPITYHSELAERNFGEFNGKENAFVRQHINLNDPDLVTSGWESFREMQYRVLSFIQEYQNETEGKAALLVTHEGCMRAIFSDIHGCDMTDTRCNTVTTSVYRFNLDDGKLTFIESIS